MNPKSLENLHPRIPHYEKTKVHRSIRLTDKCWQALRSMAAEAGCKSTSDFLEQLVRGTLPEEALKNLFKNP